MGNKNTFRWTKSILVRVTLAICNNANYDTLQLLAIAPNTYVEHDIFISCITRLYYFALLVEGVQRKK